ncbi:putative glycosyl hydrolase protein [Phaeoacremonium minimum UCRPA7]|uniref:Putative glycosyl hydrolase protein n=1 Tax=Phaeoacremonium minimum (strain UCR-PA7) TaxID=1286976 RepID=R8BV76_PHAM7|nr:putative glycosyl hydrolase protein [Phaeoacremonium minimum UCRPA7]EOO03276.1 putative glycosyl hydrolase protein [Phaeoacremonium minimum UCRPA7]
MRTASGLLRAAFALSIPSVQATIHDYTTAEAGNPFVDGWYADPDTEIYNGLYWVYPTSSYPYDEQTYLDAFSSPDLIKWTKHSNILTTADFSWATRAVWAPAPISRNGKYYLYFGANDIQTDSELGGIGVGISDNPEGPYLDAIGEPLIGAYHNGAQPIDQDVFIDDDGQAYIYYGGHSHANVALLNEDMISIGTFPDGDQFKEITPTNYVEGAQMFKRNGTYYMMWSEGGWTGPDYAVSYAMSDSPIGPFTRLAKILQQDSTVATGSGHNGVINVPGTDIWYIVYHRRPLSETDGNHRVVCYDRMYFNSDGTIQPVTMLVKDNFEDGNMIGWKTYGGSWSVVDGQFSAGSSTGGKALLDTNFTEVVVDTDITITSGTGDAGIVFRATSPSTGVDSYDGYYAGISTTGNVVLGKANGGWTSLGSASVPVVSGTQVHLRISAVDSTINVYVGDMGTPKITVTDNTYVSGMDGVRVYQTSATFDNVSVAKA